MGLLRRTYEQRWLVDGETPRAVLRDADAEVERLREALRLIADGEVDGVGDYSECVQLFAQAVIDRV